MQIRKRQRLHLGRRLPGNNVHDVLTGQMNAQRQEYCHDRHQNQRLARGRPRSFGIELAEAEGHHHRCAQIDCGKECDDDHVKAIGQPHARHRFFTQPAYEEGAQHTHH